MPKPNKKKKHFIRKKEATTYRLIPGYVEDEEEPDKLPDPEELDSRKKEQREFGIFFDDGYNYMKHVRSANEVATLVSTEVDTADETRSQASSRMPRQFKEFFSTDETENEKIDPEILAALEEAPVIPIDEESLDQEEDMDFLDDDFVIKAGGVVEKEEGDIEEEDEDIDSDDREHDFDDEEEEDEDTLSADSEFSGRVSDLDDDEEDDDDMPVRRKHEGRRTAEDDMVEAQTALILKNFEQGLGFGLSTQDEIDEPEMPSAEDYEHLKHTLKQDALNKTPITWSEVLDDKDERPKIDTSKYLYEDEDEYEWKDAPPSQPKFDCVSILSTKSNTRNLPTDIIPPSKAKKKQEQRTESESTEPSAQGLTLKQLEDDMRESRRADKASTFRPRDETAEEKRARKKAIKSERLDRRQEKKANKMVFSIENEKMKQETAILSKAVKSVKLS